MARLRNLIAVLPFILIPLFAQAPPNSPASTPLLGPDQLDNLVAPIALYPDPLLGQVLAASTYPLEIVQAQQWMGQNSTLQGAQLMEAARQQNWDASVQALVAFPDALKLLSGNVRWTTDLGNAFLAQQADVMAAVQRMRARAQANGRLQSGPQQTVTDDTQGGQNAIEIQPASPQVMYVPTYDPAYVWGPGAYPELWYPDLYGYGFGFGPGIYLGGFFPGWLGWGGWGWGCGWFGHGLFINAGFFNHFGFHSGFGGFAGRGFEGHQAWAHDPVHRGNVPYANHAVASRFNSNRYVGSSAMRSGAGAGGWNKFGSGAANNYARSYSSGSRYGAPAQSYRGSPYAGQPYSSRGYSSSRYATPRYSAPSYSRSYSAPRSYAAPQSFSAPRSYSAPHSSGGFSGGGHSFSGGGGHGGFSGGGGHGGGGGGHRR